VIDFFASTRYQMKLDVPGVDGALIFASGIARHELERRDFDKYDHTGRRLLDPQLYLSGLDVAKAGKTCTKLSSYGWFDGQAHTYDSASEKQSEWRKSAAKRVKKSWTGSLPRNNATIEDRVRLCVDVQHSLGCEAIILPTPLIATPSNDFAVQLAWLDAGLELAARLAPGVPRIATVAISDTCVRGVDPWSSSFLDTLLDQISARGVEGAYVVIEQASHDQIYESNINTLGTLVRLVRDFRAAGVARVVVPLAGVAGMLGVAVGAEVWSTGWYRSERRVRLPDFEESDEQKMSIPTYYSHPLAGDIHLKTDLDTINSGGLLKLVADETPASRGLLRALRAGQVVASVAEWEARRSNVTAAKEHFVSALVRETGTMRALPVAQRLDAAKRWLDNAIQVAVKVSALGDFHDRTALGHQRAWRNVLESASTV
jgi:hypothetical protein